MPDRMELYFVAQNHSIIFHHNAQSRKMGKKKRKMEPLAWINRTALEGGDTLSESEDE